MNKVVINKIKRYFVFIEPLPFIIILLGVVIQIFNSNFFTVINLTNILRQVSILAVVAFGMTIVIISGGIDLSISSIMGLVSVFAGVVLRDTGNLTLGISTALLIGGIAGLINGLIIVTSGIHPFVVTLGTLTAYKGIAYIYSNGAPVSSLPQAFLILGSGYWGPLPIMTWIAVLIFLITTYILYKTKFGIHTYEIGNNEEAVVTAGVNVKREKVMIYVISGLFASLAGMLLTSRVISAQANLGIGYNLQAIAAAVIGGTSLSGGRGTPVGTVFGILLIGVLSNGLNLLRISSFWQQVAIGGTIVFAVLLDARSKRKSVK